MLYAIQITCNKRVQIIQRDSCLNLAIFESSSTASTKWSSRATNSISNEVKVARENVAVLSSALIRGLQSVLKPPPSSKASTSRDGHEWSLLDCFLIISWYVSSCKSWGGWSIELCCSRNLLSISVVWLERLEKVDDSMWERWDCVLDKVSGGSWLDVRRYEWMSRACWSLSVLVWTRLRRDVLRVCCMLDMSCPRRRTSSAASFVASWISFWNAILRLYGACKKM